MKLDSVSFLKKIQHQQLFTADDNLLVAVSGGMDSMVLLHLLLQAGLSFHIAHVNYGLRAEESEGDEQFIRDFAVQHNIPVYIHRVEASRFNPHGSDIQQTARTIRYQWFQQLVADHSFQYVLLAHHSDDQSETILYQFIRGGMLRALKGMREKNGCFVRPLLSYSRQSIEEYAKANSVAWREDSSNASLKYTRNVIRHQVMPLLQSIQPNIASSLCERAQLFDEMEHLVQSVVGNDLEKARVDEDGRSMLDCEWLVAYPYPHVMMWQWLSAFNFSSAQVSEALSLLSAQTGSRLESATHVLMKDRQRLILAPKPTSIAPIEPITIAKLPFQNEDIRMEEAELDSVRFGNESIQFVDAQKLKWPITWRPWKAGDRIVPLGMSQAQKVSDVLIQKKIPLLDKAKVWVMEDQQGSLIAIPGICISNHVKIESSTNRVVRIDSLQSIGRVNN